MARLRGTGIAAVNYPTGMNLGGDPSQALIHATTSGSFVVALVGHRPRPGPADGHRPDRGRDARRRVRPDRRRHGRHGHGTARHGHVRQPGDPPRRQRRQGRGPRGARRPFCSSRRRSSRSRVDDLVLDGAGQRPGRGRRPSKRLGIADLASRAQFQYGRTIAGRGAFMKPKSRSTPRRAPWTRTRPRRMPAPSPRSRSTRRPAWSRCSASGARTRSAGRSTRRWSRARSSGGAWMGMSHALYETTEPYYPEPSTTARKDFAEYLMPGSGRAARSSTASCWRCRPPTARTASRAWAR